MKTVRLSFCLLMLISMFLLSNAESRDYTKMGLPMGAKMRIGKGMVYGHITFSPDSSLLAVPTTVGIWIYDGVTGKERNLLVSESDIANSVAFSPDGKTLVSGHYQKVHFWDVNTGTLKHTLTGHEGEVASIAFSPDGKTIATASWDDETVKLWDVASGEPKLNFIAQKGFVESLAISPDGKTIATSGRDDNNDNDTIKLWDFTTGRLKATLTTEGLEHIRHITYSPDGNTIASCDGWSDFPFVRLWDVATNTLRDTLVGHVDTVLSVAFSDDGKTIASGSRDKTVVLWDINGNYKHTLVDHTDTIVSAAFSSDGKTIATASWDSTIVLWDVKDHKPRTTINGHISGFNSINFSPDGKTIVSGGEDRIVRLWDITTGENIRIYTGHAGVVLSVAFSPDGRTIASASGRHYESGWIGDDPTIRLWDTESGIQKQILIGDRTAVYHVAYSPDGQVLVSCGSEKKATFWDTATGNPLWTIAGKARTSGDTNLNGEGVGRVQFSPDGMMASSGEKSETSVWDISSRQLIATFSGTSRKTSDSAFSPDGKILATLYANGEIHLYNIATGVRNTIISEHTSNLSLIAFSPNGKTLATADFHEDNKVRFWDPDSGELQSVIVGHQDGVASLAFSPDGQTLATASWDGTMLLWDVPSVIDLSLHESDITGDGVLSIHDLLLVAANFGQTGTTVIDVNSDEVVDIADLIKIASELEIAAVKPELNYDLDVVPSIAEVKTWINEAKQLDLFDPINWKGVDFLIKLLKAITPNRTSLLPNYPNPFNPDTWIPYQLAQPTDVTIHIYATNGDVIRTLDLGHQTIGLYHHRGSAAYWDGTNELGEAVASGIYFYTFTAGTFTATRKMVIRK